MNNIMSLYQRFMQNPFKAFTEARLNIPQGMNSPDQIIQHLLNTGQISQDRLNHVVQMWNDPQIQQLMRMR